MVVTKECQQYYTYLLERNYIELHTVNITYLIPGVLSVN